MKIAQIAPLAERVPPKKYGGTERVISVLTEELVKRGHEVTLFATGDSITSARLVSVYPKGLREAGVKDLYGYNLHGLLNMGMAYSMQDQFDIIHDHNPHMALPTANIAKTPVVMTWHGPFSADVRKYFSTLRRPYFVSISNSQAKPADGINIVGNVYNGLPMEHYPFSADNDGYLLFVGRISKEKGVHMAIEVAAKANLPLIIAAKLDRAAPHDVQYYYHHIKPRLKKYSRLVKWVGEVDENERNKLMSRALAFLHPISWEEPFGLVLIESMACGCPVIAFNRGSIPEIIANGKTGFVVDYFDDMVDAIKRIGQIDRKACRTHALANFNATKMAEGYEQIYKKIIHGHER